MVDATAVLPARAGDACAGASALALYVLEGAAALDAYEKASRSALHAPPQHPAWIRNWAQCVEPEFRVVILQEGARSVLALPLEIAARNGCTVARFFGASHANGNFAAVDPNWLAGPHGGGLDALPGLLHAAQPGLDLVLLERQAYTLDGSSNPFARLACRPSVNIALAADLEDGFDALLERMSGRRKRKKHRSQIRKFETAGGFRHWQAGDAAEVERMIGAFFAFKQARLARLGVADMFAAPQIRAFWRTLFIEALDQSPPAFGLHALEVAGKIRAVIGSSRCGRRMIAEFAAFAEDELASASPGDFLFFETIRQASLEGFTVFDFGVGDEPHKRQWCALTSEHFDSFIPLTARGRMLAAALAGGSAVRRVVKSHRLLWPLARRIRAAIGSSRTGPDKEPGPAGKG